jgi:hypothetical protein
MKSKSEKTYLLILLTLLLLKSTFVEAQRANLKNNRTSIIAGAGITAYHGDLIDNIQDIVPKINLLLGASYRLTPRISIKGEVNIFQLSCENSSHGDVRSFKSNNIEYSAIAVYDLLAMRKSFTYRNPFTPYLFGGIGYMQYNSKSAGNLTPNMTPGNNGGSVVLPMGLGLRIKATKCVDVAIEVGFRKTFTDRIDNTWEGATGKSLSFQEIGSADNSTKNIASDSYLLTQIKVMYAPKCFFKQKPQSIRGHSRSEIKTMRKKSKTIAQNTKLASVKTNKK